MLDFIKLIAVIILCVVAYSFLQGTLGGDPSWNAGLTQGNRVLQVSDDELWGRLGNGAGESQYVGIVSIEHQSTPTHDDPQKEFIKIAVQSPSLETINLTGWSLRSLVSNTRVYLPPATLLLKINANNTLGEVHLAPGEYAYVHTGHSPIDLSFHTNECIGYLEQFNTFEPKLGGRCNNPGTILPATTQNVKTYGAECIDFLNQARTCTTYTTQMPADLLPACRDLVARKLNYHSCLSSAYGNKKYDVFNNGGWYLYLDHDAELWRNTYEAIQLLDAEGKVVDVLRY